MVQSNLEGRSRTRRTRQSEEQAPLVESYLSSNSSTIYHGTNIFLTHTSAPLVERCPCPGLVRAPTHLMIDSLDQAW